MADSLSLPIYRTTYVFTKEILTITSKFPRNFKFIIGDRLCRDSVALLVQLARINRLHSDKVVEIDDFLAILDAIRMQISLANDMRILTVRQSARLIPFIVDIQTQALAWRKYQRGKGVSK